jgi:adenylyltransferase/sulfurtransferase
MNGRLLNASPGRQSRARRAGYEPRVLEEASVVVVGAGALGQNVLLDLGLTGVRELRIVDGDFFEDHNLTRSPLFPPEAEVADGLMKASAVGARLAHIHTAAEPRVLTADTWVEELGLGAFEGADVIAACVDSLEARSYLAQVALFLGLPIVDGGFSGANVGVTMYPVVADPTEGPCWRCGGLPTPGAFSCRQAAAFASAAGVVPALQNGAAALAGLCAEAVVMMLHGRVTEARRISLDIRSGESLVFNPGPAPDCAPGHRRLAKPPTVSEIGIEATVRHLLEGHGGGPESMLFLPDAFVESATCPECLGSCAVEAPTHRWRHDPRCTRCGGPWSRRSGVSEGQDLIVEIDIGHPRVDEPLANFGIRPADIVEISGVAPATVRIAGEPAELWNEVA